MGNVGVDVAVVLAHPLLQSLQRPRRWGIGLKPPSETCGDQGGTQVPLRVLGWLLTVGAITLGAPFWFDAMNRLGSLRNTGGKPEPADGS